MSHIQTEPLLGKYKTLMYSDVAMYKKHNVLLRSARDLFVTECRHNA